MSCWRVLNISQDHSGIYLPQLLVKPVFTLESYGVYLTDLSNIWSEELDLDSIIQRASQEQSPIEVNSRDTSQVSILLDNVIKSLSRSDEASCNITRTDSAGLVLHTTIKLPQPLGSLSWRFELTKATSTTLRNELILPLLLSCHIQNERIAGLLSVIDDKDKAIGRLLDQCDSNHSDLAAVFPGAAGLKSSKSIVKRGKITKHVPALQPFKEKLWNEQKFNLGDPEMTTLDVFQGVLAQSNPAVPPQLRLERGGTSWWTSISDKFTREQASVNEQIKKAAVLRFRKADTESSADETEDEFETPENFEIRNLSDLPLNTSKVAERKVDEVQEESTIDDDDLDRPAINSGQSQSQSQKMDKAETGSISASVDKTDSVSNGASTPKPQKQGIIIGGKTKKADKVPSPLETEIPVHVNSGDDAALDAKSTMSEARKSKRSFIIGGKAKAASNIDSAQKAETATSRTTSTSAPDSTTKSSPTKSLPTKSSPTTSLQQETAKVEATGENRHDETPEQKVERKRAELKRKNNEAAKKQDTQKRKKRF